MSFLRARVAGEPHPKRGMILCGPPGCGKTTLLRLAARSLGASLEEIFVWNFSSSAVEERACLSSMMLRRRAIVVVDGAEAWMVRDDVAREMGTPSSRRAASSSLSVSKWERRVNPADAPIVLVATSLSNARLRRISASQHWLLLKMPRLRTAALYTAAAHARGVREDDEAHARSLRRIARLSHGDGRQARILAASGDAPRMRGAEVQDLFELSRSVLSPDTSWREAIAQVSVDERVFPVLWEFVPRGWQGRLDALARERDAWSLHPRAGMGAVRAELDEEVRRDMASGGALRYPRMALGVLPRAERARALLGRAREKFDGSHHIPSSRSCLDSDVGLSSPLVSRRVAST